MRFRAERCRTALVEVDFGLRAVATCAWTRGAQARPIGTATQARAELETLRAARIVFQEGDRILGLIIPPRTPISVPVETAEFAAAATS